MERKTKWWLIGGGVGIITIAILYRNRHQFFTTDTTILKIDNPYERIQAMGGVPVQWGTTGARLVYGKYQFYPNNRAFMMTDDKKNIVRRGSFDDKKIMWDDKTTSTPLDSIFS